MPGIDTASLQTFLTSNNIISLEDENPDISKYGSLLQLQIDKIASETGLELNPTAHTDVDFNFNWESQDYNVRYYPVNEIHQVRVDNKCICPKDYILDKDKGRLHFLKKLPKGEALIVEYMSCESDSYFNSKVLPLAYDMLLYSLDKSPTKNASSIKEGDLSVNYDTNTSLNAMIINRLNDLKNSRRGVVTRML